MGGGFLELVEELLSLRQIKCDGRTLQLFERGPL